MNSLFVWAFAPVFAWLWMWLGRRRQEPSTPIKFSLGLILVGAGFAVLIVAARLAQGGTQVSPMWLTVVYLLHTFGELCLSPVGLSAMTKLAPARIAGLMMGVWFLADLGWQLHRRAARRLLRIDAAADAVHQRGALRHRRRADPAAAVAADQTADGRGQLTRGLCERTQ